MNIPPIISPFLAWLYFILLFFQCYRIIHKLQYTTAFFQVRSLAGSMRRRVILHDSIKDYSSKSANHTYPSVKAFWWFRRNHYQSTDWGEVHCGDDTYDDDEGILILGNQTLTLSLFYCTGASKLLEFYEYALNRNARLALHVYVYPSHVYWDPTSEGESTKKWAHCL